jgi:hypothetical protein
MIKQTLLLAALPVVLGARATCVNDPPELGDIGPASELVCGELERRFPGAALAVEGRSIQSPTEVSVITSVDGTPVVMNYELVGYSWRMDDSDNRTAHGPSAGPGLSMQ